MTKSKQHVFDDLIARPVRTKKCFFVSLSLLLHGLVIGTVMVIPLLNASESDLPQPKVINAFLAAAAEPAVPTPPSAPAKGSQPKHHRQQEESQEAPVARPVDTGRMVAPVDIPSEIDEGSIFQPGSSDGVVGGSDIGVVGGDTMGIDRKILGVDDESYQGQPVQVTMPRLIKQVEPVYSLIAIKAHVQGFVIIEAATDIYGRVIKTRVISGHPLLKEAAIQAVNQWRYEPYIINGIPKPVIFTVSVNFRLQK